jgi:rubrerythrin
MERAVSLAGVPLEELFEMAALVEQGGFDFYARLSSRSDHPRARNEWRRLRDDEGLHKSWFLAQLRALGTAPLGRLSDRLQEELEKALLGPLEDVFAPGATADAASPRRIGAELARRSIELYTTIRDLIPPVQREELGRIIADEMTHRTQLEALP